ncbi:MAG: enoyl-CoA hydratase/isomerase family protein [Candidatus Lokiarchaeota archaeon]|nr:enoyl-CoA hydratase/isomerase family protein [Candidatus Lokiarchaeota archaeon]
MFKYENIKIELDESNRIATLHFNRPNSMNAFSFELVSEFCKAINELRSLTSLKCLIITGMGKNFSVGGDIKEFKEAKEPQEFMGKLADKLHEGIMLLKDLSVPSLAAVNGPCFGASLGYACSCDIRICRESASFGAAFAGIGLSPDSSTSYHLPKLVGLSLATEMILLNRIITAKEALQFGLVSMTVPDEKDFLGDVMKIALKISQGPTIAYKNIKDLLNNSYKNDLVTHLKNESEKIKKCAGTKDFQEGIKAFLEKRKPNFEGK